MIKTIIFIAGPMSGRAESVSHNETIEFAILRDFTEYRLAGSAETATRDELVYVYYASDVLPAVRSAHAGQAMEFLKAVAISSSAAVAMTMWLHNTRPLSFCIHTMHEIATDHLDAFCRIALKSKRFRRLQRKGLADLTTAQVFGKSLKGLI